MAYCVPKNNRTIFIAANIISNAIMGLLFFIIIIIIIRQVYFILGSSTDRCVWNPREDGIPKPRRRNAGYRVIFLLLFFLSLLPISELVHTRVRVHSDSFDSCRRGPIIIDTINRAAITCRPILTDVLKLNLISKEITRKNSLSSYGTSGKSCKIGLLTNTDGPLKG